MTRIMDENMIDERITYLDRRYRDLYKDFESYKTRVTRFIDSLLRMLKTDKDTKYLLKQTYNG